MIRGIIYLVGYINKSFTRNYLSLILVVGMPLFFTLIAFGVFDNHHGTNRVLVGYDKSVDPNVAESLVKIFGKSTFLKFVPVTETLGITKLKEGELKAVLHPGNSHSTIYISNLSVQNAFDGALMSLFPDAKQTRIASKIKFLIVNSSLSKLYLPGLVVISLINSCLMSVAMQILYERQEGISKLFFISPIRRLDLFIARSLFIGLVNLFNILFIVYLSYRNFNFHIFHPFLLLLVFVCAIQSMLALGYLLGNILPTNANSSNLIIAFNLFLMFTSTVPFTGLDFGLLSKVAYLFPPIYIKNAVYYFSFHRNLDFSSSLLVLAPIICFIVGYFLVGLRVDRLYG